MWLLTVTRASHGDLFGNSLAYFAVGEVKQDKRDRGDSSERQRWSTVQRKKDKEGDHSL